MKRLFREFYYKPVIDFDNLSKKSIVVFDTNVLLHIFRFSIESRKKLLHSMLKIENNIWIPYIAALEYNLNKQTVIHSLRNKENNLKNNLNVQKDKIVASLNNDLDNIGIKSTDEKTIRESIKKTFKQSIDTFVNDFISNELLKEFKLIEDVEDQSDILAKLLDNKVGAPPTQKEIDIIQKDGANRYSLKCPPGFEDEKEKDGKIRSYGSIVYQEKFGDLLIWDAIVKHAKNENFKTVIFISDDTKEDWIYKVKGKKIGPRAELKKELLELAGADLIILNTNSFLAQVNKNEFQEDIIDLSEYLEVNNDIKTVEQGKEQFSILLSLSNAIFSEMPNINFNYENVLSDEYENNLFIIKNLISNLNSYTKELKSLLWNIKKETDRNYKIIELSESIYNFEKLLRHITESLEEDSINNYRIFLKSIKSLCSNFVNIDEMLSCLTNYY